MWHCYHKACDDERHMSSTNLYFLKTTVDVLLQSIMHLMDGKCYIGGKLALLACCVFNNHASSILPESHPVSGSVTVRLPQLPPTRQGRHLPSTSTRLDCFEPKRIFNKIESLIRASSSTGKLAKTKRRAQAQKSLQKLFSSISACRPYRLFTQLVDLISLAFVMLSQS